MSDQVPQTPTPVETPPTTLPVSPTPTPEPAAPPAPEAPKSLLSDPPVVAPFDAEKLTLPDGFDKSAEPFVEFMNLAKETGLSGEVAQKLVDFHLKHTQNASQALTESWEAQQEKWVGEVKVDKEIGNIESLRQTIAKVADNTDLTDPEFRNALAFTGAGNHPAILRTLFRWAKALGEGSSIAGSPPARNANSAAVNEAPSLATALYGPTGPHSGGPKLS